MKGWTLIADLITVPFWSSSIRKQKHLRSTPTVINDYFTPATQGGLNYMDLSGR